MKRWTIRAIIGVFAVCLYLPSLGFDFAYDDILQILLNPQVIKSSLSWGTIASIFGSPTPPGNLYRPAATLSYLVTKEAVGLTPVWFHLQNIAIYAVACVLVFEVMKHLLGRDDRAAFVAFLFAAHPIHTEAVANIIGRCETAAALFVLLSCLLGRRAALSEGARSISFYAVGSASSLLVASFFKESSLTGVAIVPMYAWFCSEDSRPRFARAVSGIPLWCALAGVTGLSLLMRKLALGSQFIIVSDGKVWPENPLFHVAFADRILPALKVLGDYFRLLFFPFHLSADYSAMPETFFAGVYSADGLLSLGVVAATAGIFVVNRTVTARVLVAWVVIAFAITINLLTPIGTIMGERIAFLPSVGSCGLIVYGMHRIFRSPRIGLLAMMSLLTAYVWRTDLRLPVWRDNGTLFRSTVMDAPNSPKAWYNLGVHYVLVEKDPSGAESYFRRALEIHPDYPLPAIALADIIRERGDWGRLEYWYRRILSMQPDNAAVKENLDRLLEYKKGRS